MQHTAVIKVIIIQVLTDKTLKKKKEIRIPLHECRCYNFML